MIELLFCVLALIFLIVFVAFVFVSLLFKAAFFILADEETLRVFRNLLDRSENIMAEAVAEAEAIEAR